MEKKDLLQRTQDLIKEASPLTSDLLMLAGFTQIQKHVLNYFREDLDYPKHSAKAIVKLSTSMLSLMGTWPFERIHYALRANKNLNEIRYIWRNQLKG